MTGAARRRAAVSDALRDFDRALGRKPAFAPSLDDLADRLHGVSTTLDQLKPQVVLGRIDRADLHLVVRSIAALHDSSRELKRLADATTLTAPADWSSSAPLLGVEPLTRTRPPAPPLSTSPSPSSPESTSP